MLILRVLHRCHLIFREISFPISTLQVSPKQHHFLQHASTPVCRQQLNQSGLNESWLATQYLDLARPSVSPKMRLYVGDQNGLLPFKSTVQGRKKATATRCG
ncbi:hypothetical protein Forpe1208_v016107 [Fusarium oxysporum f. sp. rapae]|uniref:Uncharacterized protein n=1 Tax=Fusarium oxysporum f. sp. rapae TaxID=485398 RepID=A0A8J5TXK7_FUSOX|nr:hypothetical protein Forpe1208_v016107 [Fusarium oxysporum f. sp. rapae]